MSPLPSRSSAPDTSNMTLESVCDATVKAMRVAMLAFSRPVTTSTVGLWVASTKWIPVALPIWANRTRFASDSRPPASINSASSSTTNTT